jgi:hypothetical protein
MLTPRLAAFALALTALSCDESPPPDGLPQTCEVEQDFAVWGIGRIDMLFVISNAPTMVDEQTQLAANAPRFIRVLEMIPDGLPDVHIGVVTADPAEGGVLRGILVDEVAPNGERSRNYSGSLVDAFTSLARVGMWGSPDVQPLEVVRLALDPANTANAGFHRNDGRTLLVIVLVTDQDDASPAGSAVYADDLKAMLAEDRDVVALAVAPTAARDHRIGAWQAEFPYLHAAFTDIANEDWSDVLFPVAALFTRNNVDPCISDPIDTTDVAPAALGVQLGCSVSYQFDDGTGEVVPRCELDDTGAPVPGSGPCWRIFEEPLWCSVAPQNLAFWIERQVHLYHAALSIRCPCAEPNP